MLVGCNGHCALIDVDSPAAMATDSAAASVRFMSRLVVNRSCRPEIVSRYWRRGYSFGKAVRLFEIVKLPSARAETLIQFALPV
mgnify:CR=1 FL=1